MKMWKKKEKKRKGWGKDEENEKVENKKINQLPDKLETLNLDYSSEVNDNEWKCEKRRKKTNEKNERKMKKKKRTKRKNSTNFPMR